MRHLNVWARLPRRMLVGLVRLYRLLLSPWVGQSCRFSPTCSVYAIDALNRHGAVFGTGLAAWRILRCNPLCTGGCDPVPDNMPWARSTMRPSHHRDTSLFIGLATHESGAIAAAATSVAAANDDPTLSKTPS